MIQDTSDVAAESAFILPVPESPTVIAAIGLTVVSLSALKRS